MLASKAFEPRATFPVPVVLLTKAAFPTAVLLSAVVFDPSAWLPMATLPSPVVLASKAILPTAVFCAPVVFAFKAS